MLFLFEDKETSPIYSTYANTIFEELFYIKGNNPSFINP